MSEAQTGRIALGMRGKKVDFHTHLIPRMWVDFSRRYGYGGFIHIDHNQADVSSPGNARLMRESELVMEIGPNCWDIEARLQDMDRAGVDVQVVSTIPELFSYWAKADDAADLARILNNEMAEQIRGYPDRFVGLGTVPLQAPELAVAELERCMKELNFAGVIIGTHINEWNLDAPELVAFWEAAEELGAVVFVHPNNLEIRNQNDDAFLLPKLVGLPAEMCHAVACFLTGGVFDKFPRLTVCFAHGAGTFPYIAGQLQEGLRRNISLKSSAASLSKQSFVGKFFCDSIVQSKEATAFLLEAMSEDQVVFGSDYPFPLGQGSVFTGPYDARGNYDPKLAYSLDLRTNFDFLPESTLEKMLDLNVSRLLSGFIQRRSDPESSEAAVEASIGMLS